MDFEPLEQFEFAHATRIVFGAGSLDRIGPLAREIGARVALLVTDAGLVEAGHAARAARLLDAAGVRSILFDRARENPTSADVEACADVARSGGPGATAPVDPVDLIIGLGGGSAIDCAKGANYLLTNGGSMRDYQGWSKASRPMLPMFAVPTTAGTGSEVQSYALIADDATHMKMACGDPKALPCIAILDPELATTQPREVVAHAGLDAVSHAVETAVTRKRTPLSGLFAREAFRLAHAALPRVLAEPRDVEAQGAMLLAATYAGIAIENSMLGAAHSMANPLTARASLAHGHAVAVALPHVVRYNAEVESAALAYAALARTAGLTGANGDPRHATEVLAGALEALVDRAGLERTLRACGVERSEIGPLAALAAQQWTAQFNPRAVGEREFRALYEAAL